MKHGPFGPVPELTGSTSIIFHVGDPIVQVRTPSTLNPELAARQVNSAIVPLNLKTDRFEEVMRGLMASDNVVGFIFTVPFKAQALSLVDEVGGVARAAGGINAMRKRPDGSWVGDQFDGAGFVAALVKDGITLEGRRVLLVGAGGAGKAIALALAAAGIAALDVCDIDIDHRESTIAAVQALAPQCRVEVADAVAGDQEIIINATPLGMRDGDPVPIDVSGVGPDQIVFDIIPTPETTRLMEQAQERGARVFGGRRMVAGQASALLDFFGLGA